MKVDSKKRIAEYRQSVHLTGSWSRKTPPSPLDDRVAGIIGEKILSGIVPEDEGDTDASQGEEVVFYAPLALTHLPLQLVHSIIRRLGYASLPELRAQLGEVMDQALAAPVELLDLLPLETGPPSRALHSPPHQPLYLGTQVTQSVEQQSGDDVVVTAQLHFTGHNQDLFHRHQSVEHAPVIPVRTFLVHLDLLLVLLDLLVVLMDLLVVVLVDLLLVLLDLLVVVLTDLMLVLLNLLLVLLGLPLVLLDLLGVVLVDLLLVLLDLLGVVLLLLLVDLLLVLLDLLVLVLDMLVVVLVEFEPASVPHICLLLCDVMLLIDVLSSDVLLHLLCDVLFYVVLLCDV
ncbi:hypothetical protein N1851_030303 [Merluccius polli]|uniref:Uncharacterized protein n=1 Tax=Merluccius polli TaxID=89951 RepID=A0AA47M5V4_MERPO|nr:hypothetical protein N1851_030303 [Merluccius polli]